MKDFDTWYKEQHGYAPFPWQSSLAERLAAGDWPDALTCPTASGKTGVVAAWAWAVEVGHNVPRRLVYVVDRRLIVDSVTEYAQRIAASMPENVRPVVERMRGGASGSDEWLDPVRPAVIVSTVDQAGSRLLFAGYGISRRTAPVHAALLGNDAVWVLDEVHLAEPLLRSLRDAQDAGARIRLLPMSATYSSDQSLGLSKADLMHPVLSRRLSAPKPTTLVRIPEDADLSEELASCARSARAGGAGVVAVVCNRIDTARAVYERLTGSDDSVLLIGRIREADRSAVLAEVLPQIGTGTREGRTPLFVVATQTIEVGADLDFDALVTECAPLSALRQRAGRLNRLGELKSAPISIVYQPRDRDAVYGDAVKAAWSWLEKAARIFKGKKRGIDFAPFALDALARKHSLPEEPTVKSPALLRGHVDLLAMTSALGRIDVAPWLHGWQNVSADVAVCWRADYSLESVEAAPPSRREILEVPVWALKAWAMSVADIDAAANEVNVRPRSVPCLIWDGESASEASLDAIRPGMTVVLRDSVGGCDRWGWNPKSSDPVRDVGDTERRVRLHPAVHPELAADVAALVEGDATDRDWRALATQVGLSRPGLVMRYDGGAVVTSARESTSYAGMRPVSLRDHLAAVGARAGEMAQAVGLPSALVDAVRRAGHAHDLGKRDPRWQAMVGGSEALPLAKGPGGGDVTWLALPRGWRHEVASALSQSDPLVRHLVGSHHGNGRPLFPAAPHGDEWEALIGWGAQFARLNEEHGAWGLAYLEALVRLADWQVSVEEQSDVESAHADRTAA